MFSGIMDAVCFGQILDASLVPFIASCFVDQHRFKIDNDHKHRHVHIEKYLERNSMNWLKFTPKSPDLNPIENL